MDYEQPLDKFTITDLETLRVIADPLRSQIYETLTAKPLAIKDIAERLGLSASKLYYHVNLLEKHGLLRVVETRTVANMIEKIYWIVAQELELDESLLSFSSVSDETKDALRALMSSTLDATREDILRSLEARSLAVDLGAAEQPREFLLIRQLANIPDELAAEFFERVKALAKEFEAADEKCAAEGDTRQTYGLLIGFYPTFYFSEDQNTGES